MKWAFWIVIGLVLAAAGWLLFTGPRMLVQPNFRAFQTRMSPLPKGVVPAQPLTELPSAAQAGALTNPAAATAENLARGKVYYGYYCLACHGLTGRGDGPVGQSYVPVPRDLTSAQVQSLSDGGLLRAMLTGTGHARVLERVVPPEHRWSLVLYVRSLGTPPAAVPP